MQARNSIPRPLNRPLVMSVRGDLQSRMQRQLHHDISNVTLHGVARDVEAVGDFLVAQPRADEIDDFTFAWCHAHVFGHTGGVGFALTVLLVARLEPYSARLWLREDVRAVPRR